MVTKALICIVDDSADYRLLLQQSFHYDHPAYSVVLFASGEALLDALSTLERVPSLVLLDVNMPGLTGPQTIRQLRQQSGYEHTPMILMSVTATPIDACDTHGADYFLQKPLSFALLRQRLTMICHYWLGDR